MKKSLLLLIALGTIAVGSVQAESCNPKSRPQPASSKMLQIAPRMEMTACDDGVIDGAKKGELLYVRPGERISDYPLMPKGQQQVRDYVLMFSIPLDSKYAAHRPDKNTPILLLTGSTSEEAQARIAQVADHVAPTTADSLHQPRKPPGSGGSSIRSFTIKDNTLSIFTEADFAFAIIYDPATGKKLFELRYVKKG